jgi:hypothetical protein
MSQQLSGLPLIASARLAPSARDLVKSLTIFERDIFATPSIEHGYVWKTWDR